MTKPLIPRYKPTLRCAHDGCIYMSGRGGKFCKYHLAAISASRAEKAKVVQRERNDVVCERRKKQRLSQAITLVRKAGYTVELARSEPEAFPS